MSRRRRHRDLGAVYLPVGALAAVLSPVVGEYSWEGLLRFYRSERSRKQYPDLRAKPGPNEVRFVEWGDDGHVYFQCLRCGCSLEGPVGAFCTFCGTRWATGHVTNRRRQQLSEEVARREHESCERCGWVIEQRYVSTDGRPAETHRDWHAPTHVFFPYETARQVLDALKSLRANEAESAAEFVGCDRVEYRARRLRPEDLTP